MLEYDPKLLTAFFIEYARNNSAYRFLVHKSEISDINLNMIIESMNATFFEKTFPYKKRQRIEYLKRTIDTVKNSDQVDQESDQRKKY